MNGLVGEERALKRESAGAREGECWRKGKESEGSRGRRARAHREGERAYFFLYIILTGW